MRSLELLCYVISMLLFLGFAEAGLSDEEKEELVRAHNFYRGKVDPIATNMEQMVNLLWLSIVYNNRYITRSRVDFREWMEWPTTGLPLAASSN